MADWVHTVAGQVNWNYPGDLLLLVGVQFASRPLLTCSAKWIDRMNPVGAARLTFAWLAAAMPGLVFPVLVVEMIHTIDPHRMGSLGCMIHCYGLAALLAAAFGLAVWKTWSASHAAQSLAGVARTPSPRLAAFAAESGVAAWELDTDTPICTVGGIIQPRVYLSRGALNRLPDCQLRAALAHESAHVRRREPLIEGIAAFLNRCTLFPAPATMTVYRRSREFCADKEAARCVEPVVLASLLISFARFELVHPGIHLAEPENLRDRVFFLLDHEPCRARETGTAALSIAAIGFAASLAWLPAGVHMVERLMCSRL